MPNPDVTVVIPNFNSGRLLERAVTSALNQKNVRVQVVVVDDGSTDRSLADISTFDSRVLVLRRQSSSGSPGVPRNEGVMQARGDWVAFLDSDDFWLPEKLDLQLDRCYRRRARACATNARILEPSGLPDSWKDAGTYFRSIPTRVGLRRMIARNWIITSSVLIDRHLLAEAGRFPENGADVFEDWALWLRVAAIEPWTLIDRPLTRYTRNGGDSFSFRVTDQSAARRATFSDFESWVKVTNRSRARGVKGQICLQELYLAGRKIARHAGSSNP